MKKNYITIVLAINVISSTIFAQTIRTPFAAPYLSLSGYSKLQTDAFSMINNQAVLAQIKQTSIGLYTEQRFMLAEVKLHQVSAALPSKLGNIGINLSYMGFKNYSENKFGIAYGKQIGNKLDLGIQFNYFGFKIPSNAKASTVNVELGAILHLTNQLNIGLHLYNPVGAKLSSTKEKLPAIINVGCGYDVSEAFFCCVEMVKEQNVPVSINAGLQYNFSKQFYSKFGLMSAASVFYVGFGVGIKKIRIDVSGSYHPILGFSPGLMIVFHR